MRGTGVFTWYRFLNSKATVQNKTELILQLGIKKLTHFYYKVFLYFWFDGHCHLMNKMKWINKIIDLSSKNCVWINPNCRWHKKKKKRWTTWQMKKKNIQKWTFEPVTHNNDECHWIFGSYSCFAHFYITHRCNWFFLFRRFFTTTCRKVFMIVEAYINNPWTGTPAVIEISEP